ncbi:MAG: peptidoglycan-binding domain-containing protein [Ktedonobacterales bacterium]
MRSKHFVILGSILLVAGLFLAFTPVASNAFAAARIAHSASRASTITHTTASSRLTANTSCPTSCPNPINACPSTLQQGSTGTWVQILDYRLNDIAAGGTPLSISTSFTAATKTAVEDFQRFAGISHDGIVGPQTWSFLSFCTAYTPGAFFGGGEGMAHCPASLSENNKVLTWVSALQDLLNVEFYYGGFSSTSPDRFTPYLASDGIFGPQTKAAVIDFQYALGLGASGGGTVGDRTWNGLLMCY